MGYLCAADVNLEDITCKIERIPETFYKVVKKVDLKKY
jgi:hypothetical protein